MSISAKILLVEDSPSLARTYRAQLEKAGHVVLAADSLAQARTAFERSQPDCVLLDLQLPDGNGLDLLQEWQQSPDALVSVVVITANGSMTTAIDAMRAGASDFIVKPFDAERLQTTVVNAVEKHRLVRTVHAFRKSAGSAGIGTMIGSSLAMQAVYKTIEAAAPGAASVFITGESGTGKELAARALHEQSERSAKPFVALNCGALPKDLLESELFGHIKGAFTGATADRAGAAATADGGTLFLDEICEMDLDLQSKLLRFIQLGEYRRVGEDKARTADIRFVCATNRSPAFEVKAGRFREDLFYRLHVIPLALPPLRERGKDIGLLAESFLGKIAAQEGAGERRFDEAALNALNGYAWPGNVRELENLIRRLVVLTHEENISTDMVLEAIGQLPNVGDDSMWALAPTGDALRQHVAQESESMSAIQPLWVTERDAIESAVSQCEGNIQRAARMLEISPSTIYRKRDSWLARSKVAS